MKPCISCVDLWRVLNKLTHVTKSVADMIKEGCTIIDVGINREECEVTGKMKLVGDVDVEGEFQVHEVHTEYMAT